MNIVPRGAMATVAIEFHNPNANGRVPSIGSTAISTSGPSPVPNTSPLYSMGASSFSPSPMTTTPRISMVLSMTRIASTATLSARFLSPLPICLPAASAAASVTRTRSNARLRVGVLFCMIPPFHLVLCELSGNKNDQVIADGDRPQDGIDPVKKTAVVE